MKVSNADILIVGAGTAGMPCAIEAATRGASVLVVEKAADVGGALWLSGGQMSAGGTRLQHAKGIKDSAENHYKDILRMAGEPVDTDLVHHAAELASDTVDWLEDLGFPFDPDCPAIVDDHEHYGVPRTYWGPEAGISILKTLRPRWDELAEQGKIEIRLETEATELLVEDNRVSGAILTNDMGDEHQANAKHTVLTTGGYAASPEIFAALTQGAPPLVSHAPETSTGDGILLARALGAQIRNQDVYVPTLGGFRAADTGVGRVRDWRKGWALIGSARMRSPREIYVDAAGRRFMNEDEVSNDRREHSVRDLDDELFWAVFDQTALHAGECLIMGWENSDIEAAADGGEFCWRADTIEGLAEAAAIDPQGLVETVNQFNNNAAAQRDPLGRQTLEYRLTQAPYYAFRFQGCSVLSWAGLSVDDKLRVLRKAGQPIQGLYAAGEVLGMAALSGSAFVGGMSVTPAISFGRWLAKILTSTHQK